jgi:hypothetical protein
VSQFVSARHISPSNQLSFNLEKCANDAVSLRDEFVKLCLRSFSCFRSHSNERTSGEMRSIDASVDSGRNEFHSAFLSNPYVWIDWGPGSVDRVCDRLLKLLPIDLLFGFLNAATVVNADKKMPACPTASEFAKATAVINHPCVSLRTFLSVVLSSVLDTIARTCSSEIGTTCVSSENSDRFHSGNSEPSGDSRKG